MTVLGKFNLLIVALLSLTVIILAYAGGYTFPPTDVLLIFISPVLLFGPLGLFYTYFRPDRTIAVPCMNIVTYNLFLPPIILFGS